LFPSATGAASSFRGRFDDLPFYDSPSRFSRWLATAKIFCSAFLQIHQLMKILLVHPDDSIEAATGEHWHFVIDLGWSGRYAYSYQTKQLGFRVSSIFDLLDHEQHHRQIRELLSLGFDQILDSESIDWWEAFSTHPYAQLEHLMMLSALIEQIPASAEVFATRPHFAVRALSLLLNRNIQSLSAERDTGLLVRSRRYLKAAFALRPSQITEIAFDKWDDGYRLRRHFAHSTKTSPTPVILLPSAYANVTRSQVAYARMLPQRHFLLVVTRRNGRIQDLPGNIQVRSLASYAPRFSQATDKERIHLLARWQALQEGLFEKNSMFRLAKGLRILDGFPNFLENGLRVRDAWREVFAREPIAAVLSADEYNPYTRLPILLARSRKLRTVFCDHGALNLSFGIRRPVSQTYLMKGEMARDYAVSWGGLSPDKILVGASADGTGYSPLADPARRDWIVFYSEAYELSSGRAQSLYAELLPELCSLASRTNRKVILKLHPFESHRVRKLLVEKILSGEQRRLVKIREGPMTPDLFARSWCSFTVESSVAIESTLNGVPCFLCGWFDASWYEYGKQYAKFHAGHTLDSPQEIREVPELLKKIQITEATRRKLQTTISVEALESVLSGDGFIP
jgi:hypothetical protein